jgi:hypothetical protein
VGNESLCEHRNQILENKKYPPQKTKTDLQKQVDKTIIFLDCESQKLRI